MTNTRPPRAARPAARRPARQPTRPEALEGRRLLSGLSASYYDNADLTGAPAISRIDAAVSFNWQSGSPDALIAPDTFSARWVGQVRANYSEEYTFYVTADDGARLWVNGQLLIDTWAGGQTAGSGKITLEAGRLYDITAENHEQTGLAQMKLSWESASQRFGTIPTSMLYPPSTPATPAPALVLKTPGIVNARSHGAMGDGLANDAPALQRAIDATPAFGTLRLEPRTYKLNKGLILNKPMNLEGNGALLLLNTSTYPDNHHIWIGSELGPASTQWSEPVVAGQSTFHPTFAPGVFSVGQWVFVELGQDPHDRNEQHYTGLAPVTAVGTNSVTLGLSVPHDIRNGALPHKITPLTSLGTQVHVRDLKFDHVDGTIPNAAIWVDKARNTTIDGVSGRANILSAVVDSANVSVRNVDVSLTNSHRAAGRAFSAWQSDNVNVSDVRADTSFDTAPFFIESWSRNTRFSNIKLRWRYAGDPRSAVFHLTGGSSGTVVDELRIENTGAVMLAGSGTQAAGYRFGAVTITGAAKSVSLASVDDLTLGSRRYTNPQRLTKTIDLGAGWDGRLIPLVTGVIKSVRMTASDSRALTGAFVLNRSYAGGNILSSLLAGKTVDLTSFGFIGTAHSFNDATQKTLALSTPAILAPGARLTIEIEYFPATR